MGKEEAKVDAKENYRILPLHVAADRGSLSVQSMSIGSEILKKSIPYCSI